MAEESTNGDRTEAASDKRLRDAREQGNVPLSREAAGAAVLAAAALATNIAAPDGARHLAEALARFLSETHRMRVGADDGTLAAALLGSARAALVALAPFTLGALIAGVGAVVLQTGPLLHLGALMPRPGRLNPIAGLARLVAPETLIEAGKSVAKLVAVALATWRPLSDAPAHLSAATGWSLPRSLAATASLCLRIMTAILVVQIAIAAIDVFLVRRRHAAGLRMSREDQRQEHRESEGDPRIKARIRQLRLARARQRMMAAVPTATVVVTNPTHYAVALTYDRTRNAAPRVVAKGVDEVAARIRAKAEEHGVPLLANPPLARALFTVELDVDIPAEHFQAVAEIIAYVWRIDRRQRR